MSKFTEKQLAFVQAKADGLNNENAMIAAGYSPSGAAQNATNLMKRGDIRNAIREAKRDNMTPIQRDIDNKKARRGQGVNADNDGDNPDKTKMPREFYDDPKQYLMDMMNHKGLGITTRANYAVQLMPYMHARIGEKGKKDSDLDKAKAVVGGKQPKPRADGKPKFAPGKAPKLVAVK